MLYVALGCTLIAIRGLRTCMVIFYVLLLKVVTVILTYFVMEPVFLSDCYYDAISLIKGQYVYAISFGLHLTNEQFKGN